MRLASVRVTFRTRRPPKGTPVRLRPLVLVAAAATLVLAACGSGDDTDSSGPAWTYTSGDGKTYTADEVPTRIIAQDSAAAALISHGIKPVGMYLSQPLEDT